MSILVTGSRELTDQALVVRTIMSHAAPPLTIVVGDCPCGADKFARSVDAELDLHQAQWKLLGRAAGPRRNQEMVDSGVDLCLAFYREGAGNRGTQDCVRRARNAGVPVDELTERESRSNYDFR